jgi:ribosomal-protein-alanine N-acetyltransferase
MIKLRRLELSDLDAVHALISRMDVVRHMLLPLRSREESEHFLQESLLESPFEPWKSVVRAIINCVTGAVVGLCDIVTVKGAAEGEMWYLVHPDFWGEGIATEAARELLRLGFREVSLHRIWATCLPENPASERVLRKVGMRKEGFLLQNLKIHGV